MRASTVSSSIPTSETGTYRSMTRPLSRMRSMTSASPLGLGERIAPPPLRVVIAVVAMVDLLSGLAGRGLRPGRLAPAAAGPAVAGGRRARLRASAVAGGRRARLRASAVAGALARRAAALLALLLVLVILDVALAVLVVHLDVGLEALEVGARRALDEAPAAGDLLERTVRVDVDVELDAREPLAELVEGDDADVLHAADRPPDDARTGLLVDDLGLPLPANAPDLLVEDDAVLAPLLDGLDAVHELREVLEVGELLVDGLQRRGHVDRLLDRHAPALAGAVAGPVLLVVVITSAEASAEVLQLGQD